MALVAVCGNFSAASGRGSPFHSLELMRTTPKVIKSLLLLVGGGIFSWTYLYGDQKEFFIGIVSVIFFSCMYVIYALDLDSNPEPKSPRAIFLYRVLFFGIFGIVIIGTILMAIALIARGNIWGGIKAFFFSAIIILGAKKIWESALTRRSSGTPQKRGAP